ncbi:putative phage tail protein (plasmid) [Selenomonas ruminantium subsp. lactilytica TAM6421]|uniref:Putative phage tail protein n=1 Tax=Selenomonas ruminantium subsp. lactilytica (strain NBRC 103574 / TAM6421) TaxID=927704 RepID=I0GWF2_SELRL|nr:phage tail protein [Selenomonas ruminantium]BAL85089.1 putative phage tail protein [Selenomonas ruminantium subsp. lactilytica TAM6421]
MDFNSKNIISDEKFEENLLKPFVPEDFKIDLQLFGHHSGGKGVGKVLLTLGFAAIGFCNPAMFGITAAHGVSIAAGVMGAALASTVWTAINRPNMDVGGGSPDVQRFDRAQETMSSDGLIPVIYGYRKITGNQTYHQTDSEANQLHKHVVLCEGGIDGIESVCANDLLIPTEGQQEGAVFTIQNRKYEDATVELKSKYLYLTADNKTDKIYLCNKDDASGNGSFYEWQMNISSLISYINRKGEGWEAFPTATTTKYPGDLKIETKSYQKKVSIGTSADCDEKISDSQYSEYLDLWNGNIMGGNVKNVEFGRNMLKKKYGITSYSDGKFYKTITATDKGCYMNPVAVKADTVKGGTKYVFHDCEPPDNYEEVGGYPQLAWLDMHFNTSAELNGNPTVSAIIRGKKVYDMRTGKTEYSTNPALCLRDFMLSKRYGMGKWITEDDLDDDSWREAADYCDEVIEFHNSDNVVVKAKRYELNMVIDQSNSAINWLQEILANFCGYLTIAHGKFSLKIEKKEEVSYRFNDSNCSDLSVAPLRLSETPNKYSVKIIDPRNNWQSTCCLCEDFSDQKERGKIVTKEVQLNGVTSQNQALRLARFYRDYNLACPLQLSFTTGYQAMHLEPGDVVTVTYHDVFKDLPIRIAEIKETEDHKFTISGRQYNPDLYNDDLGGGISWYNYVPADADSISTERRRPGHVTDLTAVTRYRTRPDASVGYDIAVSFKLPERYDVNTAMVYYKTNSTVACDLENVPSDVSISQLGYLSGWKSAGESQGTMLIPNVHLGDEYEFMVQAKSDEGLLSSEATAPHCNCTVKPRRTVPASPQNLHYDFSDSFLFMWDDILDSDVKYYELRTDEKVGNPNGLLGRTTDRSVEVSISDRTGKAYLYAVNFQGKHSYPATCEWSYPKPNAPSYVKFEDTPRGIAIKVPSFPPGADKVRFYISGAYTADTIDSINAIYEYKGKPDVYSLKACYVDRIGEGNVSHEYSFTISPTFKSEWIDDESISLDKVDKSIAESLKKAKDTAKDLLKINESITALEKSDGEIKSTVTDLKTRTASQIKQLSNEIDINVADKLKDATSQLEIQGDKISSIVTELSKSPENCSYSSISQMKDNINMRVATKDFNGKNIINQINMTPLGTTISGDYLHITGTTKFDDDVIFGGMIKAGAITADKLSANTIALQGNQGIQGGSVLLDVSGLHVSGSRETVTFGAGGMTFADQNGNEFSNVSHMLMGVAKNGDYIKFTKPWPVTPSVIVTPQNVLTGSSEYSTSNISLKCYADEISKKGFRVHAYSEIEGAHSHSAIKDTVAWTMKRGGGPKYSWGRAENYTTTFTIYPPVTCNKVRLYCTCGMGKDAGNGNSYYRPDCGIKFDEGCDTMTVKCGGRQVYKGAFFDRQRCSQLRIGTDPYAHNSRSYNDYGYISSIDIVSVEFPVVAGQPVEITLDIAPMFCKTWPYDVYHNWAIYVNSADFDVASTEKLDGSGTAAFFVLADTNKFYTVVN